MNVWPSQKRWMVSCCRAAALWGAASKICSKQHAVFLGSSCVTFSPGVSLKSKQCNHTVVWFLLFNGISTFMA